MPLRVFQVRVPAGVRAAGRSGRHRCGHSLVGLAVCCFAACSGGSGRGSPGVTGVPIGPVTPPDEPVPGDALYVSPTGSDADSGTMDHPWRTVAHGVQNLQAGDTLVLRAGTYFEYDLPVGLAGTAGHPITIRNQPGETAVIDGGFAQFRAAGNSDWQVVDAGRHIYSSTATFAGAGQVFGHLGTGDGAYRLVPYETQPPLAADLEDYSESSPFYCGPGAFWSSSDQRIYVRLVHGSYQARFGLSVPADLDPGNTPLFLFPSRNVLAVQSSSAYLRFRGIGLRHGDPVMDLPSGCHHLSFIACDLLGGRYAAIVRDGAHDILFDGDTFDAGFPPYVARSDVKRPSAGPPAHSMQDAAIDLEGHVVSVEIADCRFFGLFDAIDTSGEPDTVHVHNCEFATIRDDVFEIATAGHGIEFDHNICHVAAAGVSRNGSTAPAAGYRGTKYVHHNVIDTSGLQLYCRADPQHLLSPNWLGPAGDGMATGLAISNHDTSSMDGPDPWRIYQNTMVGAGDVDEEGFGIGYGFAPFDPAVPQEVLNNVFVQVADQWIVRHARVDDGSQVFDGNVYYRSFSNPTTAMLADFASGGSTGQYASLVAFMTAVAWLQTRSHYRPGWETSGVEADPGLDEEYRPAHAGPAATDGVDLADKGWPGADGPGHRGAVAPR